MTSYDRNGYRVDEPNQFELTRRRLQPPPRQTGQYSYDEFLIWAAANGQPSRPVGYFEAQVTEHPSR